VIRFMRYTANLPGGNPWFGIGPVYSGHAEWRHTSGVAVSFGRHGFALDFAPKQQKPDALAAIDLLIIRTKVLNSLLRDMGRRP
jgi:hypothetical protein